MGYSKHSRYSTKQGGHKTLWLCLIVVSFITLICAFFSDKVILSSEKTYPPEDSIIDYTENPRPYTSETEENFQLFSISGSNPDADSLTISEESICPKESFTDSNSKRTSSQESKISREKKNIAGKTAIPKPKVYSSLHALDLGQRSIPNDIDKSPLKLSSKDLDDFKSAGQWNGSDIEGLKYAGFSFGSSSFCDYGKDRCWSVQNTSPSDENGKSRIFNEQHLTRISLEDNKTGYDNVEACYTCKSEQLSHLFFFKDLGDTQSDLEAANDIIASNFQILVNELGIPEDAFRVIENSTGTIYFDIHTDTYDIFSSSLQKRDGNYQAQMSITNKDIDKQARIEYDEDCAKIFEYLQQLKEAEGRK